MRAPFLLLACALFARAGELQDDLAARRARLMEKLGPGTLFLVRSAPHRVYSLDVEHEYRQDSNFYYLTGIEEHDATLVLMPGNNGRKQFLFLPPKDATVEHWQGKRLTPEEGKALSAVPDVHSNADLEPFLEAVLSGRPWFTHRRAPRPPDFDPFLDAVHRGTARLAVSLDQPLQIAGPINPILAWANELRDRFPGITVANATRHVHALRQVKSPYERRMLTRSAGVSSEAHLAGMRAAKPGASEYEVKAAIEEVYRRRGALSTGYPSITGSGPNATILHYAKSNRRMDAGDLMLVDAAANTDYYTVDITRTYPVNGKFSPAQKEIYNLVLEAQNEAMRLAKPGSKPYDLHRKTEDVIKAGLLRLGLITDASGDQFRTWYTHGAVHYLGIDVHDVGDPNLPLAPGHAFVIEPGIYIRPDALDTLPKTDENLEFIRKVKPAFEKYRGIGIRIEDSFILTESGLDWLSKRVPRTIEEIESFLGRR
ncbi:MAG: aminopeptidase P family protein [Acidobacteria bacterium]|nr:aminopeptidase P family protein [Acidobacteriota bacterium]